MTHSEIEVLKKLSVKLIIFGVLMFLIDRGIGSFIENKYKKSPQGDIGILAHNISKPTEDMVVYGSSRAVHAYNCKIFTDTLGYSCYNTSRENSLIPYHETILNWSLKKHIPKVIILDITPKEFTWRSDESPAKVLSFMILPYVRRDTSFANMYKEIYPMEVMKARVSELYAYNSMILPIMMGKDGTKIGKPSDVINGYLPLKTSEVKFGLPKYVFDESDVDTVSKNKFETFVRLCLQNKVKLFVIQSPLYIQPFPETKSTREIRLICEKNNVPYWDYVSDSAFLKEKYFHDNIHMSEAGAIAFSTKMASEIKKFLQQNGSSPDSAAIIK